MAPLRARRRRGPLRPARPRQRRRPDRPGRRRPPRDRPRARRGRSGAPHPAQARGLPHARRAQGRAQEGRPAQGAQGPAVQQALTLARRYFGTDGVRGVVGESLTPDLVERLGRASALWSRGGRVFVGRDTRGSGPELEEAFAQGVASAGGNAVLAGVLPTPAVALLALDLGAVISASHNPPRVQRREVLRRTGQQAHRPLEEEIEALLDSPPRGTAGEIDRVGVATDSYLEHIVERFGSDLTGLRIAVDCANGAYSGIAPRGIREARRRGRARSATTPDGDEHQRRLRRDRPRARSSSSSGRRLDLGVAFDGDGDRMLAVDERRRRGRRRPDPRRAGARPRRSTSSR